MPLYEYECDACGQRFEAIQKFSDPPKDVCAKCGKGPIRKLMSSPAIQFKGSGWYITDYAQKGKSDSSESSSPKTKSSDKTSESTSSSSETSTPAKTESTTSAPATSSTPAAAKE